MKIIGNFVGIFLLILTTFSVKADTFWRTGSVVRTLLDVNHGGCMVYINTLIGNDCTNTGWVSLDCDGTYLSKDQASRSYASAVVAGSTGKNITVEIDNSLKHGAFCVAKRLDVRF